MARFTIRPYTSSITFNGSSSVLTKTTPVGLNTGTTSRSAMGWIYLTDNTVLSTFVMFKVNGAQSVSFTLGKLSGSYFYAFDTVNAGNNKTMTAAQFNANFPLRTWIHIAFIATTTTVSLYVNGEVLINAAAWGTAINTGAYDKLLIGKTEDSAQADVYWFKGKMKDVVIVNGALSANQIRGNYYYGDIPAATVSRFLMEEGTGLAVADSIGSNSLSGSNVTWSTNLLPFRPRVVATQKLVIRPTPFSIDGIASATSGLAIPNNAALNPTTAVTISCWFRMSQFNSVTNTLFDNSQAGTTNSYYLDYADGFRWFSLIGGISRNITTTTTKVVRGEWNFITATYTGSAVFLYLNGVKLAEEITGISGALGTNSGQLCLMRSWNALAGFAMIGQTYRHRIFNVGCTLTEHQNMYYLDRLSTALQAGKVLDLAMTEGSGSTIADVSTTVTAATIGAASSWNSTYTPFKPRQLAPSRTLVT